MIHNKLVRDHIPEIIEKSGKIAKTGVLFPDDFDKALDEKLKEETTEFLESHNVEEIADVLEVLHAIVTRKGVSWSDIEQIRIKKREERGGFEKGIFLQSVEEEKSNG